MNKVYDAFKGKTVLVTGGAGAIGGNLVRESPSLDVIHLLQQQGADVAYNDPYIPNYQDPDFPIKNVPLTRENIEAADCVILLTDHSNFDYKFIAGYARMILDTRNAFKGINSSRIFRIGGPLPAVEQWRAATGRASAEAAAAQER